MVTKAYAERAASRVMELLQPDAKADLDGLRLSKRSDNKVYRVPLAEASDEFVIVKLLPSWTTELRRLQKVVVRNVLYGEHYVVLVGKKRATAEIQRYREWKAAGLPVPTLIEFPLPYVRVIEGLPFPTFKGILADPDSSAEYKLEIVKAGIEAVSIQHDLAIARNKPGLIHPDAHPSNLFYDPQAQAPYWVDLEHPAEYPKMKVEDLAVRALRVFLYGVLHHLPYQLDTVVGILTDRYEPKRLLWALADNMEAGTNRFPLRLADWTKLRKPSRFSRERLINLLREMLREQRVQQPGTAESARLRA